VKVSFNPQRSGGGFPIQDFVRRLYQFTEREKSGSQNVYINRAACDGIATVCDLKLLFAHLGEHPITLDAA
jgi:hypothetical protein